MSLVGQGLKWAGKGQQPDYGMVWATSCAPAVLMDQMNDLDLV